MDWFNYVLREYAMRGHAIPGGFDPATHEALVNVSRAYPGANPALIAIAKSTFHASETQSRTNRT